MNVTLLGKFLRKLRVDKDLLLKDMAEVLEVSVAQLSAIELGKRTISDEFITRLENKYGNDADLNRIDLKHLAAVSQPSYKEDLRGNTEEERELFVTFARKYKCLHESDLKKLRDLLMK